MLFNDRVLSSGEIDFLHHQRANVVRYGEIKFSLHDKRVFLLERWVLQHVENHYRHHLSCAVQ
jgi:hypothetical protein